MAAAQPGGERDRHRGRELGAAEELDVVVLGRDEALPLPLRMRVDGAAELEQDGALVERELRVCVRHLHRPRRLARRPVPEPPLVRPARHVRDDVELLARLLERALEPEVVVRRHDQLVGDAALAQERRQRRKEPVDGLGLDRRLEPIVQLVPEAARHRASSRRTGRRGRGRAGGRAGSRTPSRAAPRAPPTPRGRARARRGPRAAPSTISSSTLRGRLPRSGAPGQIVASCRRIRACSSCSRRPGSIPSSSTNARRASW